MYQEGKPMSTTTNQSDPHRRLLQLGVLLFLLGLLTGFVIPSLNNPRMGLASHLEGVMNGLFLLGLGLAWPHLALTRVLQRLLFGLVVFGTFANWLATLMAAWWGAGSMMSIAARGSQGTPAQELLIGGLLFSLSAAMILACGLLLFGLRRKRTARKRIRTAQTMHSAIS
jgi:hydroxylaminobenzene mutase